MKNVIFRKTSTALIFVLLERSKVKTKVIPDVASNKLIHKGKKPVTMLRKMLFVSVSVMVSERPIVTIRNS